MTGRYFQFWGVRGSYPAPFESHLKTGGNTSCVEIRSGNDLVICDAGTGIVPLGNILAKHEDIREATVLLTHYHWDHISGLPFFLPAFAPGWKLHFFGPGGNARDIEDNLAEQMRAPYFPVETETWLANIDYLDPTQRARFDVGDINIEHFNVHHPGSTFGYRISVNGKVVVYASDNELSFLAHFIEKRKMEFDEAERRLLEDMQNEQNQKALDFMRGVDYLIHDAQYTKEDYAEKRGWGHSYYLDAVRAADEAGVKHLFLFHIDPNYDDNAVDVLRNTAKAFLADRGSKTQCHVAVEGNRIDLG